MREGYVPNLKVPGKKGPSHQMWLTLLLCVVLPPVGLILLWGGARCPFRGKLWMTALSVVVMVAAMTMYLENRSQSALVVPQSPVVVNYSQPTPQPTPVPAQTGQAGQPDPAVPAPDAPDQGLPEGVIPANPLG